MDDVVLDVPCGTGILTSLMDRFSSRVVLTDISMEMMKFARKGYVSDKVLGFLQADITALPFQRETFVGVIMLGFMHRVPLSVRNKTLKEANRISRKYLLISYSIDTPLQKLKRLILTMFVRRYASAPHPISFSDMVKEIHSHGFSVKKKVYVFPFLSSAILILLEKRDDVEDKATCVG